MSIQIRGTELEGDEVYNSLDIKNLFNLVIPKLNLEEQMENYLISVYLLKILQQLNYFPARWLRCLFNPQLNPFDITDRKSKL